MPNLAIEYEDDFELIDGKEVCMSPRPAVKYYRIQSNIIYIFKGYLRGKRCEAFGEVEVWLDKENHFIPDAMIVCNPDIVGEQHINGAPDLVVEILSTSTYTNDWTIKNIFMPNMVLRSIGLLTQIAKL